MCLYLEEGSQKKYCSVCLSVDVVCIHVIDLPINETNQLHVRNLIWEKVCFRPIIIWSRIHTCMMSYDVSYLHKHSYYIRTRKLSYVCF